MVFFKAVPTGVLADYTAVPDRRLRFRRRRRALFGAICAALAIAGTVIGLAMPVPDSGTAVGISVPMSDIELFWIEVAVSALLIGAVSAAIGVIRMGIELRAREAQQRFPADRPSRWPS